MLYQFPCWYTFYGNHFISEVNFNLQFSQANGPFPCPYINMFNSLILNKLDIMQQQRMKPSKGSFKDILICEYEQQLKISEFSSPLHTPLLNYKHAFQCSHFLILNCTASMFAFFLKYFWFLSSFLLRWLGNKCLLTPFLFTLYVRKCITYIAIFKLVTKSTLWLITYLVSSNHFTMNS